MKKILIFSFLFLQLTLIKAQNQIQFTVSNSARSNIYQIDEFFFVHQLFADAFFMTDLHKQLSKDEMLKILDEILYKISSDNKVGVLVKQPTGADAKLVFFIKENTPDGTMLAMMTNFNPETRKYTKELDNKKSLTRWYFIKGKKLVYRKDLFSKEEENKRKKIGVNETIDFYLFDDNNENDSLIKPLIDGEILDKSSSTENKLYAKLYLGEYFLSHYDFESAQKAISDLKDYFENYKQNLTNGFQTIITMAEVEFELTKKIKIR